jgi:hypothetical protein
VKSSGDAHHKVAPRVLIPVARALRRLLGDRDGLLARRIEMRLSTVVVALLAAGVLVCLAAIYFKTRPEDERLAALFGDGGSRGDGTVSSVPFTERPSSQTSSTETVSTEAPGVARGERVLDGLPKLPLWSPQGAPASIVAETSLRGGLAASPEFREIESAVEANGNARVLSRPDYHQAPLWLRLRSKMYKRECYELVEFLVRLAQNLEFGRQPNECKDSIAFKKIKAVEMGETRDGAELFAVYVGTFESTRSAGLAAAELLQLTSRAPYVFNANREYFKGAYAEKGAVP